MNIIDIIEDSCNCIISNDIVGYRSNYEQLSNMSNELTLPNGSDEFIEKCKELIHHYDDNISVKLYIYSCIINITKSPSILDEYIVLLTNLSDMQYEVKYFYFFNITAWMFWYSKELMQPNEICLATKLLMNIVDSAANELGDELLSPIPADELDTNLIVFITNQFISERHGPTKHALDHCVSVIRSSRKKVLLLNTAEGTNSPNFPLFNKYVPAYRDELCNTESILWEGYSVPFFQFSNLMPNTGELTLLINTIRKLKPHIVIEIGSGSVATALIERIVPVLTNGTLHSAIEVSATRYQTISRAISNQEKDLLNRLGRNADDMIFSMFSTKINEKHSNISRALLGIPEDSFAIAIVGSRLKLEITENFIEHLANIVRHRNICVTFFGSFDNFEVLIAKVPDCKSKIKFYGFTDDTLGCLRQCDLYLNPYRAGGGMSAIEAMAAGIPAVSMPYGDAGVILGSDFWIESEDEYERAVLKYYNDSEYYRIQADKASSRGKYLQDSDKLFIDTIEEFKKRTMM